jgi:hypothetical protein
MSYENDLISFEEMLHQHGYRVESRTARSYFEQADGNVQLAFNRFVSSLSPAPQPIPEWVQLVDPSGRTYYQNNHTQQVPRPLLALDSHQHLSPWHSLCFQTRWDPPPGWGQVLAPARAPPAPPPKPHARGDGSVSAGMAALAVGGASAAAANMSPQQMMQAAQVAGKVSSNVVAHNEKAGGARVVAGAATAGAVVVGVAASTIGLPFVGALAVCGAVGAAVSTGSSDEVGQLARKAGAAVADAGEKAVEFNREHDLTGKAARAASATVEKAKELNAEYHITEKVGAAASSAAAAIKQTNDKYHITDKLGSALGKGFDKISDFASKKK